MARVTITAEFCCDQCDKVSDRIELDTSRYGDCNIYEGIDKLIDDHKWINDPDYGLFCSPACADAAEAAAKRERDRMKALRIIQTK